MKFLAKRYGIKKVHTSMEGCLAELKEWIEKSRPKEQLAAHPEFVDLLAMNQTLMERWNMLVKPEDKVYVAGEFGGMDWRKLLNGDIIIADSLPDNGISVISLL